MFGGGGRRASVEGGRRTRLLGEGGESVQGREEKEHWVIEKSNSVGGRRSERVLGEGVGLCTNI